MKTFDWQKQLLKRRKQTKYERYLAMVLIGLALILSLWHILYTGTPEYALEELVVAGKNKDLATVEKYCDLNSITAKAYSELTRDMFFHKEHLSDESKLMFEAFYEKIRPEVTEGTVELIRQYIATGEWTPPKGNNILKGRQLGIDYEALIEKSQLRNITILEVGGIEKRDNLARATLNVRDTYTNTDFKLILTMEDTQEGWRVTAIENYRSFLDFLLPIQAAGLNSYLKQTAPIIEVYNDLLDQQQNTFHELTASDNGILYNTRREEIVDFIDTQILPTLEKRQQQLDKLPVPEGAQYLAQLRQEATKVSLEGWRHFSLGIKNDDPVEINKAQVFHKQSMDMEYRLKDIIAEATAEGPNEL